MGTLLYPPPSHDPVFAPLSFPRCGIEGGCAYAFRGETQWWCERCLDQRDVALARAAVWRIAQGEEDATPEEADELLRRMGSNYRHDSEMPEDGPPGNPPPSVEDDGEDEDENLLAAQLILYGAGLETLSSEAAQLGALLLRHAALEANLNGATTKDAFFRLRDERQQEMQSLIVRGARLNGRNEVLAYSSN